MAGNEMRHKSHMGGKLTRSPISVWSPWGRMSMSGSREHASITALYLDNKRYETKAQLARHLHYVLI